jgi:hypothetical protein
MKRQALIIANPGEEGTEGHLQGVIKDVANYRSFLLSAIGGLWRASEIIDMMMPSLARVRETVRSTSASDYALIIFCGHGCFSTPLNSTVIELRDGEDMNSDELRAGAPKQTLILDCCRVRSAVIPTPMTDSIKLAKSMENINPDECRKYYDKKIQECANGLVVMHACSIGESAGDDAQKGGYYSFNLLEAGKTWARSSTVDTSRYIGLFSVVQAHQDATPRVQRVSANRQNPTIEKPRSEPYYPLAIIA